MATTKRKSPLKGRKHTHTGNVKKHKRRVNGVNPPMISGTRKKKRSHKVSGITGNDFMDALLGTALGVGAGVLIDKFAPIKNAKLKAGLEAALGLGVAYFAGKKKNMFALGIGLGVAADGMKNAAQEFGVIKGLQNIMSGTATEGEEDAMLITMNGMEQQKVMGTETRGGAPGIMGRAMPPVIG